MKIILGSGSESRKKILGEMGYEFEVMTSDIDEKAIRFDDPKKLTLALANAKADALLERIEEPVILITADQVVSWNGQIREKAADKNEARLFLRTYHEYPAEIVTAVAVTNTHTGKSVTEVDVAQVIFKEIPDYVIDNIIEHGNIMSKAGAFAIENPLFDPYIEKVEGAIDSVMGLPKELTKRLIEVVDR
jgi:septum formation protein